MHPTDTNNMDLSLYQLLILRTLWTVTCRDGRIIRDVRLKCIFPLDISKLDMAVYGLEAYLHDGLTITIMHPHIATDKYIGTSGSNKYEITVAPDGKSFTLRSKEGVFIFSPQETK